VNWRDRLRRIVTGQTLADAVDRQRVADLIADYGRLCAEVGPWQYAADLGAPLDADLRTIAYLATWHDGPRLSIWKTVVRLEPAEA
jgi:hypothetical protein